MREVSRALLDAISESGTVNNSLRRLHREGYTLHLLLDCQRDAGSESSVRVASDSTSDAAFRIDAVDLAFLRSIGIDPTRRRRRASAGAS